VLLVAFGLLMTADQLGRMRFSRTWPVLLILFGLFKLAEHVGTKDPAPPDLNQNNPGARNL
jgi:hypothetical protein